MVSTTFPQWQSTDADIYSPWGLYQPLNPRYAIGCCSYHMISDSIVSDPLIGPHTEGVFIQRTSGGGMLIMQD